MVALAGSFSIWFYNRGLHGRLIRSVLDTRSDAGSTVRAFSCLEIDMNKEIKDWGLIFLQTLGTGPGGVAVALLIVLAVLWLTGVLK
jgi:hypothetical protein